MRHQKVLCDNRLQDEWSGLYLAVAQALTHRFGLEGRAMVREGVRRYASALAAQRKKEILESGNRTNLATVFSCGFGLPCGERACREWIECGEEQLFLNIISCPHHDFWKERGAGDLGIMFCEEYYPALVHGVTSEKAQINLGSTLMNGRDEICRLSFYLRPANLAPRQREECFPAHDLSGAQPEPLPSYAPEYAELKELLCRSLCQAALDLGGESAATAAEQAIQENKSREATPL